MPTPPQPLSARLSWDDAHRLEVLMRTRAHAFTHRAGENTCAGCGRPLDSQVIRLAGVSMHPACLPDC